MSVQRISDDILMKQVRYNRLSDVVQDWSNAALRALERLALYVVQQLSDYGQEFGEN